MIRNAKMLLEKARIMEGTRNAKSSEELTLLAATLIKNALHRKHDGRTIVQCLGYSFGGKVQPCGLVVLDDGSWGWPWPIEPGNLGDAEFRQAVEQLDGPEPLMKTDFVSHGICPECMKKYLGTLNSSDE